MSHPDLFATNATSSKVLVIGWDAADWRVIRPLIAQGKMPNLASMMQQGVHGNLATLEPILSPMLWTSIATGKRPAKHGIHGFTEPSANGKSIQPITNKNRRCKAVWNILSQEGKKCNVIGFWPSHPAEPINGVMLSNWFHKAKPIKGWRPGESGDRPVPAANGWSLDQWPIPPGAVHPETISEKIQEFRVHPSEIDSSQIGLFIPNYLELQAVNDPRLESCTKVMSDASTVHAATTALMSLEPWDFTAVYYDAIDHFGHGFMKYHPPRNDWINEKDFENFKHVVEAGYRMHDLMLGTLLQLAGDETTVILLSDHGFHPDHLRPASIPAIPAGPAIEHRAYGIFVAKGPGIRQGSTISSASLLDLTPTVLQIFGLPVGADMDGKVLVNAFEASPSIKLIPSWDTTHGPHPAGMHPRSSDVDDQQSGEMLKQLVDLGYIDPPSEEASEAVSRSSRELNFNLAGSYICARQYSLAWPLLSALWDQWPHEHRFGMQLLDCMAALEQWDLRAQAIQTLKRNAEQAAKWAQEEIERLTPSLRQHGILDREETEADSKSSAAEPSTPEQLNEAEATRGRELAREYRNLTALARPLGPILDWLALEQMLGTEDREGLEEKLGRFTKLAEARPSPELLSGLGKAFLLLGEHTSAAKSFRRSLELDSENAAAERGLARVAFEAEEWDEAVSRALTAIELQFDDPNTHAILAQALERCDEPDMSLVAHQSCVEMMPMNREISAAYARLLDASGDSKGAEAERQRWKTVSDLHRRVNDPNLLADDYWETRETRRRELGASLVEVTAELREKESVVIVSGLPRSGTSMLMQMLFSAGFDLITDEQRVPDASNPRGYFEDERVKRLMFDNAWIASAGGRVIKVVAPLLQYLPQGPRYQVLFLDRDLRAVVSSQRSMLDREGKRGYRLPDKYLMREYQKQLQETERLMAGREDMEAMFIDYDMTLADPKAVCSDIRDWLGGDGDLDRMVTAIDPKLRREHARAKS